MVDNVYVRNVMMMMMMMMRVPLSKAVDLSILWLSALGTQHAIHAMLHQSESEKHIQQLTNHLPKSMLENSRNAGY